MIKESETSRASRGPEGPWQLGTHPPRSALKACLVYWGLGFTSVSLKYRQAVFMRLDSTNGLLSQKQPDPAFLNSALKKFD